MYFFGDITTCPDPQWEVFFKIRRIVNTSGLNLNHVQNGGLTNGGTSKGLTKLMSFLTLIGCHLGQN